MNMRFLTSCFVAAITICAARVHAQEIGGRLDGRVTTPDMSPLAGVEVTVTSQGPFVARTVMTNERGRFVFVSLPVGRYRVAARLLGYRPLAVSDVAVRLGETTGLPRLVLERTTIVLDELVITAEAAGLERGTTARRMVLDASQVDALPVDRNFRSILLLASSAVPSFLGSDGGGAGINKDGINVAGATGYENIFYVDGINITSPIRGETSIDLPSNFVHQIQAQTEVPPTRTRCHLAVRSTCSRGRAATACRDKCSVSMRATGSRPRHASPTDPTRPVTPSPMLE